MIRRMLFALFLAAGAALAQGFERLAFLPHGAAGSRTPCFVADMDHDSLMEFGMWCTDEVPTFVGWQIWKCILSDSSVDSFVLVKEESSTKEDPTRPGNLRPWDVGDADGDGKAELVGVTYGGPPNYELYIQTVESEDYYDYPSTINWSSVYTYGVYSSTPFYLTDLDQDGKKDILFLLGTTIAMVYENVRNDSNRLVWSDTTALDLGNFVWSDFDCDGLTEFTSGDIYSRFVVWEHTGEDNQYHRVYTGNVEDEEGTAYDAFGGKDMDGDGKPDFFFSVNWGLGGIYFELWHYYATDNNQYAGELISSSDWGNVGNARFKSDVGDVDGDSLLEVVWTLGKRIWLLDDAAHGYKQLGEWINDHYGNGDQSLVTCADLNLDGKDEILVTGCFRTSILKWTGTAVEEKAPTVQTPQMELQVSSMIQNTGDIRLTLNEPQWIRVCVYDNVGRLVEKLAEGSYNAGEHRFTWDASSQPAGTYIIQAVDHTKISRKVTVLK